MKQIKVLLIDPATKTVTQITINDNLDGIYKAMDCTMIEVPLEFPNGDALYCDEEGKLNRDKLIGGFTFPKEWGDIIMNKALVIGSNHRTGGNKDCKSTPESVLTAFGGIGWVSKENANDYLDAVGF